MEAIITLLPTPAPSFIIADAAIYFGIPVSFNENLVTAVVGSGYTAGRSAVSRPKMARTVLAWILSFVIAFGLGYGVPLAVRSQ